MLFLWGNTLAAKRMQESEEGKIEKKPRKPKVHRPSVRMIKTAKIMAEKGGKSFREAAKEAGYSESVANSPAKVIKTQSWQALMDKYLPQDLVARKHAELLEAEDVVFIPRGKKILERRRPDYMARRAGIEMAHKLRGNFAPEKIELSKRKFQDMSNKELAEFIAKSSSKLLKSPKK